MVNYYMNALAPNCIAVYPAKRFQPEISWVNISKKPKWLNSPKHNYFPLSWLITSTGTHNVFHFPTGKHFFKSLFFGWISHVRNKLFKWSVMGVKYRDSTFPHCVIRLGHHRWEASVGRYCCLPWHQAALQAQVIPWPLVPPVRRETHHLLWSRHYWYRIKVVTFPFLQPRMMLFLSHSPQ